VTALAWIVGGLALALLAILSWKRTERPAIRATSAIAVSACLCLILTNGNTLALALLALDVFLVVITWQLAYHQRMTTRLGLAWLVILVLTLIIAKIMQGNVFALTASPSAWIGVSYFMFRLIHVSLDARRGRFGDATLSETLTYALHPTTLIAGPIDRVQHHVMEQRCKVAEPSRYFADGLWRLFIGIFKKVALATIFSSIHDVTRVNGVTGVEIWLWLLSYAFYLYFDFAGYSDIAIGAARLLGLRLPENFANPYIQPNITRFWQAWHITLSTWLRDYIFFPLSRTLLRRFGSRFSALILLVSHLTTMAVCGLWHGLSLGFLMWGIWHGLGLFVHSQVPALRQRFHLPMLPAPLSILLTFVFVTLGWAFFTNGFINPVTLFERLFGFK
jgi:D-alanyl-lipoteichoic acid acyltransferase DltB (MBOAT superfamily)